MLFTLSKAPATTQLSDAFKAKIALPTNLPSLPEAATYLRGCFPSDSAPASMNDSNTPHSSVLNSLSLSFSIDTLSTGLSFGVKLVKAMPVIGRPVASIINYGQTFASANVADKEMIADLQAQIVALHARQHEMDEDAALCALQHQADMDAALLAREDEADTHARVINSIKVELDYTKDDLKAANAALEARNSEHNTTKLELQAAHASKSQSDAEKTRLEGQVSFYKKLYESVSKELNAAEEELEEARLASPSGGDGELQQLRAQLVASKKREADLRIQLDAMNESEVELGSHLQAAGQSVDHLRYKLYSISAANTGLAQSHAVSRVTIATLQQEIAALKGDSNCNGPSKKKQRPKHGAVFSPSPLRNDITDMLVHPACGNIVEETHEEQEQCFEASANKTTFEDDEKMDVDEDVMVFDSGMDVAIEKEVSIYEVEALVSDEDEEDEDSEDERTPPPRPGNPTPYDQRD
ncbi:hypothetical protein CC85DRAFT_42998 [Cutaneotrichosporon oleaginosum]|uniref:Uncharacterized protein n=1 Tax=Cutaneotrichosporon oleaginosum TaxID=879819 RepID=A0A0J0XRI2_9TREE|nr:uncharacterized protein CC85DRAFT_42998 [Cutaneotrichosporon oleaginosum]KLT43746.1 hypothetical protein CC85DRAFT_42998 [Cutaneotrichosporon oleaginosum]TXT05163.1 hypothetical protein COLE_06483 [Cutaneotrichosporon oleaginosum]